MTGRISIRDLAKIAAVSRTTVSLALRDSHKISAPLRKRIQALAVENNYRSHPMLASLMQQIRVKRKIQDEEVIGFITSAVTADNWKEGSWTWEMWQGASEEANRLGFRLESFWAGYGAKNSRNLANMLYHRGIRGLVWAPMPWPHPVFYMPWKEFAAVACTTSTGIKGLPVVRSNHIHGVRLTLTKLKELGAKSIAIIITEEDDLRLERAWSTGVHSFCLDEKQPAAHLLRLSSYADIEEVASTFKRVRPDAVVGIRDDVPALLGKIGYKPGIDMPYASLNVDTNSLGRTAGFYQDPFYLGRRAIQYISKAIYDQSFGLPEHPESIVVEGRFVDGKSLDPLTRAKPEKPNRVSSRAQAVT